MFYKSYQELKLWIMRKTKMMGEVIPLEDFIQSIYQEKLDREAIKERGRVFLPLLEEQYSELSKAKDFDNRGSSETYGFKSIEQIHLVCRLIHKKERFDFEIRWLIDLIT